MSEVILKKLSKVYDNGFHAVKGIDLEINHNEFMVLVGPSGCGKTTTLRMIAGLETITEGEIIIGEKVVNDTPPKDRNIAMVFQNYALYPHMSVYDNIAFSLKLHKTPKDEIKRRVNEVSSILGIGDLLGKKPKQLSGGQRQRVALGRAIIRKPQVFLMDEPLSNLDAKLRVQMRSELIKLQYNLGTTFIYVTHDQTEAMTMGTRICIMNDGEIQQTADPKTIYHSPVNMFVAGFIGSPSMSFLNGEIISEQDGKKSAAVFDCKIELINASQIKPDKYIFGVRPEDVKIVPTDTENSIRAEIELIEFMGAETIITMKHDSANITAKADHDQLYKIGDHVGVQFDERKIHLFDAATQKRVNMSEG